MFKSLRNINHGHIFDKFDGDRILRRYRKTYGLGGDITLGHVREHALLEGNLTNELLASEPGNRLDVFSKAYSQLYSELPWLAGTGTDRGGGGWAAIMRPGSSVYEIGSGAGYLVNYLAKAGFKCVGTDIAKERNDAAESSENNVTWAVNDGVHLSKYAELGSYDYVISNQVIEHMHPDDIITHFSEVRGLLKDGGKYIVKTPYRRRGPQDLSTVFGAKTSIFMHLHEFDYVEMDYIKVACGYSSVEAVLGLPKTSICWVSARYMKFMLHIDKLLNRGLFSKLGLNERLMCKLTLIPGQVWVVFEK